VRTIVKPRVEIGSKPPTPIFAFGAKALPILIHVSFKEGFGL